HPEFREHVGQVGVSVVAIARQVIAVDGEVPR
ncbi:MAG: hypothetical protein QOI69_3894, partial [Pseudonocardiales bacterium]|nr:hypothetical protein [Pseudonocardiales bacterium]